MQRCIQCVLLQLLKSRLLCLPSQYPPLVGPHKSSLVGSSLHIESTLCTLPSTRFLRVNAGMVGQQSNADYQLENDKATRNIADVDFCLRIRPPGRHAHHRDHHTDQDPLVEEGHSMLGWSLVWLR